MFFLYDSFKRKQLIIQIIYFYFYFLGEGEQKEQLQDVEDQDVS